MIGRMAKALSCGALLLIGIGVSMWAGNTYLNDFPNVEVTEPDCFEFDITVSQGSGSSATLTLRVHDVDEEAGELDEVYLNGTYLGYLSGTNDTWSTTSFNITHVVQYGAANTVRICIDPGGGEDTTWRAEIDWGQILIDGGSAEDADITSVSASGEWNAIQVQTNVSATNTDTYRLEINLLDSSSNNKDIAVDTFSLTGGSSATRFNTVSLPSEPSGSEVFTIEANLFNDTTGVQQAVKTTTWTYSSEPPTDIVLSQSTVDENLPALTLVGTLSAIDSDSPSHDFTLIGGDIAGFSISGTQLLTALSFDHEDRDEYSLQIEAEDEDSNTYSEWFTIIIADINETPTASDDVASVDEGSSIALDVLDNDSDPDGDAMELVSTTDPARGTATILPDDRIEYTPDPGACGSDSFSYTMSDGRGETDTATVSITIRNLSPHAETDRETTPEGEALSIRVLDNDLDPGSGPLALQSVETPRHGTAVIEGDVIRYAPNVRYEGDDGFSYTVEDSCGATAIGWVEIDVTRTNHAPTAHAGGFYQGVVGEPLTFNASFSSDPDIDDTLQYRWDLNGSDVPNTPWLASPIYVATYHEPFFGQVTLEVRDLYRGVPTGEIARATALVRIASVQSIQVVVFEDLNGDGVRDSNEPGLPGIALTVGNERIETEADGGISLELDTGLWEIAMTPSSISMLESRGYAIPTTQASVQLDESDIEFVALSVSKTTSTLKGYVYADLDEDGEYAEENDTPLQGLRVRLDGNRETTTDDQGRFFFLSVTFGEHVVTISEPASSSTDGEAEPLTLTATVMLSRETRQEIALLWPWNPIGPDRGFLNIDVEKTEDN